MTTEIVNARDVSKRFVLHKDKSIKERLINVRRSKSYREDFWALRDIDLSVEAGATLGLVGHNGSGKSTLLKIIGGIIQPTTGLVRRRGRLAALLELGAGFHPDLTGRENVFLNASILGLSQQETRKYFDAIVDFSGIENFIDTQVKFYSSGMYVRLAFAVAVHVNPDLLLVDEVLAVGDEPFQRKCMDKIAEFQEEGRTIVVVTHSAQQVGQLCDRVAVLDHGRIVFDGEPAEGLRALRATFEEEEHAVVSRQASGRGPRLTEVRVTSADRGLNGRIPVGADIQVDLSYTLRNAPAGWIAGIDIENGLGQPVYRVNTHGLGVVLPTKPGDYKLSISLPHASFGGGRHLVYASCVTSKGVTLDRWNDPVAFDIEDDHRGVGLLQFRVSAVNEKR